MYGFNTRKNNNDTHYGYSTDFHCGSGHVPMAVVPEVAASVLPPPPLVMPSGDYGSLSPLKWEIGYSSSEYSSYGSPCSAGYYPVVSTSTGFLELDSSPVRKVFSTSDSQGINLVQRNYHRSESPLASESNSIIEGMNKACRYSPEEKKERIERYRIKRNLRNFNKKIKYECRKTLADSRPRVRGRFARNDDDQRTTTQSEWNNIILQATAGAFDNQDGDNDDQTWINLHLFDTFNFQQI